MICDTDPHRHESDAERLDRERRLVALLTTRPRELTGGELATVLPARNPTGCRQNRERARVQRYLRRAGFCWRGGAHG